MFSVSLQRGDHVLAFSVSPPTNDGWEVKRVENRTLTRHAWYRDWHRVERALDLFQREIATRIADGWRVC